MVKGSSGAAKAATTATGGGPVSDYG